jgi:tetratricopeptide (TPR) repeat protein
MVMPASIVVVMLLGAPAAAPAKASTPRAEAAGKPLAVPVLNEAEIRRHNDLFRRGSGLINPYMELDGRPAKKSSDAARDLREGIRLLDEVLKLDPSNWSALWIQGKAFQTLGDHAEAYARLRRAYAIEQNNPDVSRELMFECLELGRSKEAVEVARASLSKGTKDPGLRANLALALLLAGRIQEAADEASAAAHLNPSDGITKNLVRIIEDVRSGRRLQPHHISDLEK